MADISISQQQINSLAQQLSTVEGEEEQALLSGILALATTALHGEAAEVEAVPGQQPPIIVRTDLPLPSIKEQFDAAFRPGEIGGAEEISGVRVGHGIVIDT